MWLRRLDVLLRGLAGLGGPGAAFGSGQTPTDGTFQVRPGYPVVFLCLDGFTLSIDLILLGQDELIRPKQHEVVVPLRQLNDSAASRQNHVTVILDPTPGEHEPVPCLSDVRADFDRKGGVTVLALTQQCFST